MELDWSAWISANVHCKRECYGGLKWCSVFVYTCWFLWKWRNKLAFDSNFNFPYNPSKLIIDAVREWTSANVTKANSDGSINISMVWSKPSVNFYKLNVDGARSQNGQIGAGGVLRDYYGSWISGFSANLGCGSVLNAEIWGLLLGLRLAHNLSCLYLMVESDSEVLVNMIKQGC
ncbi:putative ribonuclease H-like domain-containing protein [Rosa chinensis]|uniref:Putative ribonuclease H-like domain-containing protein n=1 Tax=Rosa chinensis TaxID=74649 RepID=A0A2P6QLC2_ROSCH|nr:putative ribonuclease H-like domain-containing protein [Rosa chinensis]